MRARIEGLKELDRALGDLPKATGKNVLKRVLLKRAEPFAEDYRGGVDVRKGHLRDSIGVGTKLTRRQAGRARRMGKSTVEVYAGAGPDPAAHLEEFGSIKNAPNGALRSSWDRNKDGAIDDIGADLADEIGKAAARAEKRAARRAKKAGG